MGNSPSTTSSSGTSENKNPKIIEQPQQQNVKPTVQLSTDDLIFLKIGEISNNLIMEYNNDFLKEDFCNKMALVYEKKMSNFSIKLLKTLYNEINSDDTDNEIIMTLQYLPKPDDKFGVNIFKDNLEENFWRKNIELDTNIFENDGTDLKVNNIESIIKYKPKYINFKHVNNLLSTFTKVNSEKNIVKDDVVQEEQPSMFSSIIGGSNYRFNKKNTNIRKGEIFLKKLGLNENNKLENLNNEIIRGKNNNFSRRQQKQNLENNNGQNKEYLGRNYNGIQGQNREYLEKNNNREENNNGINRQNREENNNGIKRQNRQNRQNREENNNRVQNREYLENNNNIERQNRQNLQENNYSIKEERENLTSRKSNINSLQENLSNQRNKLINLREKISNKTKNVYTEENFKKIGMKPQNIQQRSESNIISTKEINETTNNIINKHLNISKENIDNKLVNSFIKYSVPKNYENPRPLCNNSEKCALTKKELCQAITENFIVRNNIIAAILTTIPFKNENGQYEGGICYQKFLNLDDCKVCVPYNFKELIEDNLNIENMMKKVLEKADYLDEKMCKDNQGYFFKLSGKEKLILAKKRSTLTEEELKNHPSLKYNLYFFEFTKKLKDKYFTNLNSLILILEKIKETPIINNETLNIISNETKKIIDDMYNLCHYYYVYAIISLINADVTEQRIEKIDKISSVVSKALVKNSVK